MNSYDEYQLLMQLYQIELYTNKIIPKDLYMNGKRHFLLKGLEEGRIAASRTMTAGIHVEDR